MFWKFLAETRCGPGKWAFAGPCGGANADQWRSERGSQHQAHSRGRGSGRRGFGVRRPLRYMARQLDLDEQQVNDLAAILDELKTQRAQASVDHRKAVSAFADAFLGDEFDAAAVKTATEARASSAAEVESTVAEALGRTFKLLDPDQRKRLAYLLRSGGLTI